ncbi:CASP-like protein 2B1 [Arachis ipaensis]|uniref:CASP-like protein 2B1 n=1 Tax=Arachis ipaensis TaxID=130454 RepID=UPI0007AF3260|nr:CASP-like protein 2B1 [Arachis ipaensis]XP_025628037.1 CASP-like protein 2B1 [Arachis hypogaea]
MSICLEKISYLGVGVSLGTVPVYHSTNLKLLDKRIKIADLVLKFMILGLGVVAAVLIRTDSQVKVFFSFEKKAKFTDVKALIFLVVANGLAAGYSFIQGFRCVVSLVRGSILFNKPLAWAIFSADQFVRFHFLLNLYEFPLVLAPMLLAYGYAY